VPAGASGVRDGVSTGLGESGAFASDGPAAAPLDRGEAAAASGAAPGGLVVIVDGLTLAAARGSLTALVASPATLEALAVSEAAPAVAAGAGTSRPGLWPFAGAVAAQMPLSRSIGTTARTTDRASAHGSKPAERGMTRRC
jgi:hypothetical protein